MKRIFLLKGLDCPNCSAKIEKEVGELDGVQSSVVNLKKQTLKINVTQTAADTIASQIETIVYSHEPVSSKLSVLLYGILPDSQGVMPLTDAKLQILLPPVALQDHIHTSHSVLERVRFVL